MMVCGFFALMVFIPVIGIIALFFLATIVGILASILCGRDFLNYYRAGTHEGGVKLIPHSYPILENIIILPYSFQSPSQSI